ncbi:sensor histidine kinase [Luteimonas kalidii]|uniref:histidine kinase n=1 Tax=Luteimonas kalidii TaxID=3042025 RepID=A0ABT6JX20_9GAMM|nr:HAMP domain-containing sensor histidine kinase [Luteimonas kalidii]MDH5835240.1 HAMP domain-containing sensor histidine kinase [Luteimonas kalidii]
MHEFLGLHRSELIARCHAKVLLRAAGARTRFAGDHAHGIHLFIDQLVATLRAERIPGAPHAPPPDAPALPDMGQSATLHGRELMRGGFTVEEVVHDYGDLCQAISDLAFERDEPITVHEFRILNRCLDDAIACAVTEYGHQHDLAVAADHLGSTSLRLGMLAHELRNQLCTATLALAVLKEGKVGVSSGTGKVLERALTGLGQLIDRSLAEVRATAGTAVHRTLLPLAEFVYEARIIASLGAAQQGGRMVVPDIAPTLAILADRDLMQAAVGNLLQNAFKHSPAGAEITLSARAAGNRILIEIRDQCGGLPAGAAERMFSPYTQLGGNRSGVGLGLSIARRSVEANQGHLRVRDLPGSGCVFTIDLPRHRTAHAVLPVH